MNDNEKFKYICKKYLNVFALLGTMSIFNMLPLQSILEMLGKERTKIIIHELVEGYDEINQILEEISKNKEIPLSDEEEKKVDALLSFLNKEE